MCVSRQFKGVSRLGHIGKIDIRVGRVRQVRHPVPFGNVEALDFTKHVREKYMTLLNVYGYIIGRATANALAFRDSRELLRQVCQKNGSKDESGRTTHDVSQLSLSFIESFFEIFSLPGMDKASLLFR